MALTKDGLKRKLLGVFEGIEKGEIPVSFPPVPPPPLMAKEVAAALARAYDAWVGESSPTAVGLTIVSRGSHLALAAQLSALPLMAGWTPGLVSYWTATTWGNNPLFVPVNPTFSAALVGLGPELAAFVLPPPKVSSKEEAADRIAEMLHKYSMQIKVSAISVTGAASALPIV